MRKSIILSGFLLGVLGTSVSESSFEKEASTLQQKAMGTAKSTSPQSIPGFQTSSPHETNLNESHALEAAAENVWSTQKDANTLKSTAESRAYFVIDPNKDPVIKNSIDSVGDPEKVLSSSLYSRKLHTKYTFKTCEESKPSLEFKCAKSLIPPEMHVDPAKYTHFWCTSGMHGPDDSSCMAKKYYPIAKMYEPEKIHLGKETWTSNCGALEERTQKNVCQFVKKICPKGSETREISGTMGSQKTPIFRKVTKDCWRYEYIYDCSYPSINTCEILRKSTCEQIKSECLKKISDVCVLWNQTYRCPGDIESEEKKLVSQGGFPLPKVSSPEFEANQDMNDAISKLALLKDIQDDMRSNTQSVNSVQIFKGQRRNCTIAFAGFENCCMKEKGWGLDLGLTSCNSEEKDLAIRQKKLLCIGPIGVYCSKRFLGICIQKKRSYCCFPTKLSRILHEQGRGQLYMGWGDAQNPICRGFTVQELARLNFDQLNLSELYTEILSGAKTITQSVVKRNLSDRVSQMTEGLTNKSKAGDF